MDFLSFVETNWRTLLLGATGARWFCSVLPHSKLADVDGQHRPSRHRGDPGGRTSEPAAEASPSESLPASGRVALWTTARNQPAMPRVSRYVGGSSRRGEERPGADIFSTSASFSSIHGCGWETTAQTAMARLRRNEKLKRDVFLQGSGDYGGSFVLRPVRPDL